MKVLLLGVFTPNSNSLSHLDGFNKNNCDVITYDFREKGRQLGSDKRDEEIIELTKQHRPDFILFPKCNEINIKVIIECNKISKTVLWYMDPLNSNFNTILIDKIKRCTYTFCALWGSYLKAKEIGGDKVYFLHEGYDQTNNYPIDTKQTMDVTFIGQLRGHRNDYHNEYKFNVVNDAYAEEHSKIVSSSKINLNFTHGGTSDRTYKILASRGFLLTEPWPMMEEDFTIGKDLAIFKSKEEMVNKINYYLNNNDERLRISYNGLNVVQKFNTVNWATKIIKTISCGTKNI